MTRPTWLAQEQGPDGIEVRALARTPATRASDDDSPPVIEGYGAVTGVITTIEGWFSTWDEQVASGAFANAIDGDVRSMFNHDTNWLLGRTAAGSLRLSEDDTGLLYSVDINPGDADAMAVYARVKRGDVSGSSIWFYVAAESWQYPSDDNDLERPLRTITDVSPLVETGPVVFPAFTTTTAAARSFGRLAQPRPPALRTAPSVEGPPGHSAERYGLRRRSLEVLALMGGHPL